MRIMRSVRCERHVRWEDELGGGSQPDAVHGVYLCHIPKRDSFLARSRSKANSRDSPPGNLAS